MKNERVLASDDESSRVVNLLDVVLKADELSVLVDDDGHGVLAHRRARRLRRGGRRRAEILEAHVASKALIVVEFVQVLDERLVVAERLEAAGAASLVMVVMVAGRVLALDHERRLLLLMHVGVEAGGAP